MLSVEEIITALDLKPHPEGGYFRETYRSEEFISKSNLSEDFQGSRNYSTSIYYLLESKDFSAFHKINQDEIWHFYSGNSIELHCISEEGKLTSVIIGKDITKGEVPQYIVPKHHWFAAKVVKSNTYALVGCTVSPGFDFKDFELASYHTLSKKYPEYESLIKEFTRQ